jgi:hypothetical protein
VLATRSNRLAKIPSSEKRGPHKVGDANKFMPRCALNFEEHGVRYAGLDRSAVGSRKYFTALALSKGVGVRFSVQFGLSFSRRSPEGEDGAAPVEAVGC